MSIKKRWAFLAQIYADNYCRTNSKTLRALNFDRDVIVEFNNSSNIGTENVAISWRSDAPIGGTGTLTASGTTITMFGSGASTIGLAPGYWVIANSIVRRIVSITDGTHFVVDSTPSWSSHSFTYLNSTTYEIASPTMSDLNTIWTTTVVDTSFTWKGIYVSISTGITGEVAWRKYCAKKLIDFQYQDHLFDLYPEYKRDVFTNMSFDYLGVQVTAARKACMDWVLTDPDNTSNLYLTYEALITEINAAVDDTDMDAVVLYF
jgi:hypothetical protein